jgi:hypothetical protein
MLETKTAPKGGVLLSISKLRDAADLDGVRAHRALSDFNADLVPLAEFVELYVDELVGVEEEVFVLALYLDETESFVGQAGDCSFLHSNENVVGNSYPD